MKITLRNDERGVAHLVIILVAVVVVGAIGFAGYRVMNNSKDTVAKDSLASAVKEAAAKCNLDDKDLCKFFASWKENKYYKMVSTDTADGATGTMTMESAGADKSHIVVTGNYAYEMFVIGDTTYIKDTADGKWWKQTLTPEQKKDYVPTDNATFEEPAKDAPEADKTTYKKLGKEACGKFTCFKYQVIDPAAKDETQYMWFDDDEYQARRNMTERKDGSKSDVVFSYEKASITAPSPVKEVGPNQVVVPGQSEPMCIPSDAELKAMMEQYTQ